MRAHVFSKTSLRRWTVALSMATLVGGASNSALADEERDNSWSFGAGVGGLVGSQSFRVEEAGSQVWLVPADGGAGTALAFSVERRLSRGLWLTARGEWRSSSTESLPHDEISAIDSTNYITTTRKTESDSSIWGASLGARYVINPGATVEFGPFLAVGVTGGSATTTRTEETTSTLPNGTASGYTSEATASSFGPTAGVGFTVEAFLARNVSLRLSSLLASVTSESVESDSKLTRTPAPTTPSTGPVEPTKSTGTSTNWGVTLSPVLELRIAL